MLRGTHVGDLDTHVGAKVEQQHITVALEVAGTSAKTCIEGLQVAIGTGMGIKEEWKVHEAQSDGVNVVMRWAICSHLHAHSKLGRVEQQVLPTAATQVSVRRGPPSMCPYLIPTKLTDSLSMLS